jgi:hypothetical protein
MTPLCSNPFNGGADAKFSTWVEKRHDARLTSLGWLAMSPNGGIPDE